MFFFFAGHGVALGPDNILLAADMPKPGPGEDGLVRDEGFSVDNIIRRVQGRGALTTFLVLDACRDNPFEATGTRNIGGGRGLTRTEAPRGVFVLYSAGIGQTALDVLRPDDPNPQLGVHPQARAPAPRAGAEPCVARQARAAGGGRACGDRPPCAAAGLLRPDRRRILPAGRRRRGSAERTGRPGRNACSPEPRPPAPSPKRNGTGASAALAPPGGVEQPPRNAVATPTQPCPDQFSSWKDWSDELTCKCAPAQMRGSVWGSGIYTHDSSVCAAARHAGVVTATGGVVRLRAAPGQPRYAGSLRHGVMTADWGRYDGSFLFTSPTVATGEPGGDTHCPANVAALRGTSRTFTCQCPPQPTAGEVWGSGVYTDDSSPCLAAVHAGVIDPSGGKVTLAPAPAPGRASYAGSTKNGVTSSSYGRWNGSFRFVQ